MIKLPYINRCDVNAMPEGSYYLENGWIHAGSEFRMTFEVDKKVNLSFDIKHQYGDYEVIVSCGGFSIDINPYKNKITGSYSADLPGNYSEYRKSHTMRFSFVQKDDGLYAAGEGQGFSFAQKYEDLAIGNLTVRFCRNEYVRNIVCLESENMPRYLVNEAVSVDSISNWEIDDSNKYVLTNTDSTGVVHINQETLDKILADNDIVACMMMMEVKKKGEKLKNLELAVGSSRKTVENPHGKSTVMIGLEFSKPSNMGDVTLTVRE